jgi:Ca2+-binding RTX toxin-like protein
LLHVDLSTAGMTIANINAEIVVARNGTTDAQIIAELDNVEEITINTLDVTANNGNGGLDTIPSGDTINVFGDFAPPNTSLNFSTITVNGGMGADTVDISGLTSDHRIVFNSGGGNDNVIGTLRPQDVVNLDDRMVGTGRADTMFGGTGNDTMFGMAGDDRLRGGMDNDRISGGAGRDVIVGGQGADWMHGGGGNDRFAFDDGHTGLGANRDVIARFGNTDGNNDRINLVAIDANTGVLGGGKYGQAFDFIGHDGFSAIGAGKGEVRYYRDGHGNTVVQLNVDNDVAVDMEILLVGYSGALSASEFSL